MIERWLSAGGKRRIIVKNAFWLLAAQGINRALRFVIIFVAARYLGPGEYGSFSYALAAATVAFVFADWGVSLLVIREFERHVDRAKLLRSALGLKVVLTSFFAAFGAVGYFVIDEPGARSVYLALVALMAVQQIRDYFIYLLRARERMEQEFLVFATEGIVTLGLATASLLGGGGPLALGMSYLVGMAVSLMVGMRLAGDTQPRPRLGWDRAIILWFLRNGWSLTVFGVLVSVFFSTDQIMLGRLRPAEEVGLYAVAAKIVMLALVIPQVAVSALFPHLVRIAGSKRDREVAIAMTAGLTALGLGIALTMQLIAPWLVGALGGSTYQAATPILRHLVWIIVMIFPVTFLDFYLIANGRQVPDMVATAVAAGANIALNVALVPRHGVTGAIVATMIGQGINTLLTAGLAAWVMLKSKDDSTQVAVAREEPPTL